MAAPMGVLPSTLGAAVLGQSASAGSPGEDKNQQVADLLHRSRQAMAENDLDVAESLIAKAESLGVQYSPLYMGDTPKKARRDLERKRNAAAAPSKPSRLFSAAGPDNMKKGTDPFAGRVMDSQPAYGSRPLVNGAAGGRQQFDAAYTTTQPGQGDIRAPGSPAAAGMMPGTPTPGAAVSMSNSSPLRAARLALAVGDVRRAQEYVNRARAMQVNYQPSDDTPDRVEAAVRKYQELSGLDKSTEAYSRGYARSLMDQADGLARWGEYAEAERLADRAANVHIVYGPFEQKPEELLQRITAARRQDAARGAAMPNAASGTLGGAPGMQQRGVELLRQAREAIVAGQLDRAEGLALAAERLRLPDATYGPGDRPSLVLSDIREMRQRGSGVVLAGGIGGPGNAARAMYDANNDATRNMQTAASQPSRSNPLMAQNQERIPMPEQTPTPPPEPIGGGSAQGPGMSLFRQGEDALKAHDPNRALELFRQAAKYPNDLDPVTAQRLQAHLQGLSARPQPGAAPTMADDVVARQQVLVRQVAADLAHRESNARALRETDPKGALAMLQDARKRV
ncbi:MAG: hypothetical protein LLG00_16830, partial [Planctomycetaceae bacterium]|nr:hypothetical protein [Planctomycetaceae bacterium]